MELFHLYSAYDEEDQFYIVSDDTDIEEYYKKFGRDGFLDALRDDEVIFKIIWLEEVNKILLD